MTTIQDAISIIITADGARAVKEFDKVGKSATDKLGKAEHSTAKMQGTFLKAGVAMGATSIVLGKALYEAGKAASDLQEATSKSSVVFGEASRGIEDYAKSASKIGLSTQEALDAAGSFGVLFTGIGKTTPEAAKMSKAMVDLAADMASFSNASPEETLLALQSGLRGENEPLRKFGVLLDDATLKQEALSLGIIKTTKDALTPAQKAQAAYSAILKQTSKQQGDVARTSDGFANTQRRVSAEFKNLETNLGQAALPLMEKTATVVGTLVEGFSALPGPVQDGIGVVAVAGVGMLALSAAITTVTGASATLTGAYVTASGAIATRLGIGQADTVVLAEEAVAAQAASVALAELAAAAAAAGAGEAAAALGASSVAAANTAVATTSTAAAGGLAAVGAAAATLGPLALITAGAIAILNTDLDDMDREIADQGRRLSFEDALEGLGEQAGTTGKAIRDLATDKVARLVVATDGAREALERAGVSQADYAIAVANGGEALTVVQDKLAAVTGGTKAQNEANDKLYYGLQNLSDAFEVEAGKAADLSATQRDLAAAGDTAAGSQGDLAGAVEYATGIIDAQKKAVDGLTETVFGIADVQRDAASSAIDWAEAQVSLKEKVDDLAKARRSGNPEKIAEAERDYQRALLAVSAASDANAQAQLDLVATRIGAKDADDAAHGRAVAFVKALDAQALTLAPGSPLRQRIEEYANQLRTTIPAEIRTQLAVDIRVSEFRRSSSGRAVGKDPNRAAGGPVEAGMSYTVGEFGRETFVPSVPGTIIPNGQAAGSSDRYSLTVYALDPQQASTAVVQALQTWNRQRGKLPIKVA